MDLKIVVFSCILMSANADRIGVPIPSLKRPSTVGEFPYHVSLALLSRYGRRQSHYCSGSIIADQWILTSGNCVTATPDDGHVVAIAGLRRSNGNTYNQSVTVKETFVHENYSQGNGNDFALLKLKSKFKFHELVAPIKLPPHERNYSGKAILTGWGTSTESTVVLQTDEVRIIENNVCNDSINARVYNLSPLHDANLCTESMTRSPICIGDSGSPLVIKNGGQHELAGIFSWTVLPCDKNGYNSVYGSVFKVLGWIEDVMEKKN